VSAAGSAKENVTVVVTGAARNFKTKDGRKHLHYGMTVAGFQYGFFAEPLTYHDVLTACGALGSVKQDRDGTPIVYLKDVTITRRPDVIYNSQRADEIDFNDLPDLHPFHNDRDD